jgi:hypothetical protein
METNREKFMKLVTGHDANFLVKVKWRVNNRYWLRKSQYVASVMLSYMDRKVVDKKTFAELLNVDEDTLGIWLKGSTDFKLSELAKIEQVTGAPILYDSFDSAAKYAEQYEKGSIDFTQQAIKGKAIVDKYLKYITL